jgi:hypothetical protein
MQLTVQLYLQILKHLVAHVLNIYILSSLPDTLIASFDFAQCCCSLYILLCCPYTAESSIAVQHILNSDMDKFVLSDLKNQLISFSDVNKLVKERYELKVEVQHYSSKVNCKVIALVNDTASVVCGCSSTYAQLCSMCAPQRTD